MRKVLRCTGASQATIPTRPNAGLEIRYRRKLDALINDMNASVLYWITAAYKKHTPLSVRLAADRSIAKALARIVENLTARWAKKFDDIAPSMAKWFVDTAKSRTDASMMAGLKKSGFTIKFTATKTQTEAVQASIAENVALIKSIPAESLSDVQGIVMRAVAEGRDIGAMRQQLQDQFGVTKRRAQTIARDQNNKATAVLVKTRQQELGITHAIWRHSHGGKVPRPEHVKANGQRYEIAKGMFLEGKWVWPGTEINCRCVSASIVPGLEDDDEDDD